MACSTMSSLYVFFDLDSCLYDYPAFVKHTGQNIQDHMVAHLGYSRDTIEAEEYQLYKNFGNTLRGIASKHSIKFKDWFTSVHVPLPYEATFSAALELREVLLRIPGRRIIFTNSDRDHTVKILSLMGILDCFHDIVDFNRMNPSETSNDIICKPDERAFKVALGLVGVPADANVTFLDDSLSNLKTGARLGWHTIQIGTTTLNEPAKSCCKDICDIGPFFKLSY